MEYYDKLLTLGKHLSSERQFELYEFLRKENSSIYLKMLEDLRHEKIVYRQIANAEIKYELTKGFIRNSTRELNGEYCDGSRVIRNFSFGANRNKKFINYFAQCDVDAIANFPMSSDVERAFSGFGIVAYPFYSLNYYSRGKGKLLGILKKRSRIKEIQDYISKMNNLGLY